MMDTIQEEAKFVLETFPKLAGRCLGGSAALSLRLTEAVVSNEVALGSLICRGIPAFTYSPIDLDVGGIWDGHAWVVIADTFIMDISLLRTVRERPENSNVKSSLKSLLNKGAIGFKRQGRISTFEELIYVQEGTLPKHGRDRLIRGLMDHHGYLNDLEA